MTADQFLHLRDGDLVKLTLTLYPESLDDCPTERVNLIDGEVYVDGIYFPEREFGISELGHWKLELP